MTSYYHLTEHIPSKQQPANIFLQLIDQTLNTVHVIGSQNHPEVSWFLTGPRRSHEAAMCIPSYHNKPQNIHRSDTVLSMIGRPGCLLPELAIRNKNFLKRRCLPLYTRHRGPMGFLTVRQLGKLCTNGAIPPPVLNTVHVTMLKKYTIQYNPGVDKSLLCLVARIT